MVARLHEHCPDPESVITKWQEYDNVIQSTNRMLTAVVSSNSTSGTGSHAFADTPAHVGTQRELSPGVAASDARRGECRYAAVVARASNMQSSMAPVFL